MADAVPFVIPAGTLLSVCPAAERSRSWKPHTTRRELHFRRFEHFSGGAYVFKEAGWLILVGRGKVREAEQG